MDALVVENVVKSFGAARAVDGLSFSVPRGSICGFLGPNGAGKTTTIRMAMDIIRPDSGRLTLLDGLTPADARSGVGYMPEERGLYPKMRVGRVLSYIARIKGIKPREIEGRIRSWLDRVGLAECVGKKVEELSRGMQQKIQFIAAAIHDPDILILDEPFASLDPINADLLKDILLGFKSAGKTVLFSTHIMEQAEQLCDHIVLIHKGRNVLCGTLESIRGQFPADSVDVELEGDPGFLAALPQVKSVARVDGGLRITLREGADDQQLLAQMLDRVRIRRFELTVPSLHQIFILAVGEPHE
ncbi:MAG: ATP-binding cassette domain-containing protein [Candidatus Hydrogenedentes bacterium]|nr:ATP-binding cassette domain-containing protein [Candidatus Hydrogenedentota bacterium]